MAKKIPDLLKSLRKNVRRDDFIYFADEVVEELESASATIETVEPILRLMEENPDVDFGVPGSLVHFVETFYKKGYEELLIASLERQPTVHTVWMLNRLLNDMRGRKKARNLSVLDDIISRRDLDKQVLARAREFRELH
jgi:hypothetical protein